MFTRQGNVPTVRGPYVKNHFTLFSTHHPTQVCVTVLPGATSLTWKYCAADTSSVRWLNTECSSFSHWYLLKVFENARNSATIREKIYFYTLETIALPFKKFQLRKY